MSNKVCAVVVTYNRLEMLKECIEAIKAQTYPCDILVVNNCSIDGTEEYLIKNKINHKTTEKNTGGAGGFNLGIKISYGEGYEHIWIMDDDCVPNNDALEELMNASNILNNKYGYLGSTVLWKDGKECIMNRHKVTKDYYEKIEYLKDSIIKVCQSTFVSLLFRRETIKMVGLPIKEYFIWGDDIEYTRRIAQKNKMDCYLVGKSIVIHKMKDNVGSDISKDSVERLLFYRYAFRNENYTYRQFGIIGVTKYIFRCFRALFNVLIFSDNSRKLRIKYLVFGIADGFRFKPKIEKV